MILILFLYIVKDEKEILWPWWILAGVNAAIYLTALFSPVSFWIDEWSFFHSGPLASSCIIISAILLAVLLLNAIRSRRRNGKGTLWIPAFVFFLIAASVFLDYNMKEGQQSISFLTIVITVGSVFYYIWLHLQFVREHERDLMAAQRIQIMMSQIQPHFLYNTLSTIQALCDKDPKKASETTGKFAIYLRQNIDTLSQTRRIPFEKEMEHTQIYADIEMIRFPNIRLVRDIQDRDFTVPVLTVQPLVENAIRHGVRIREDGVVEVSTRRTPGFHEITIRDNGRGFDAAEVKDASGSHIGLANVQERIEQMCGGTLAIESRAGEGTTVTIRIPAEDAVSGNGGRS